MFDLFLSTSGQSCRCVQVASPYSLAKASLDSLLEGLAVPNARRDVETKTLAEAWFDLFSTMAKADNLSGEDAL